MFPAMELRIAFPERDLRYLANLCHGCGSCFHHCQYAPPHEFDVPEGIMKYASFMASTGALKKKPADWKELFFPHVHRLPGN